MSPTPRPHTPTISLRPAGRPRFRRIGSWLLVALGLLFAVAAGVLLLVVLDVVPLGAVLPSHLRAAGPAKADTRALLSIGAVVVAGLLALTQGAHRLALGAFSVPLAAAVLALGALLLGALALVGCGGAGPAGSPLAALAGGEWTLVAIDGEPLPTGAEAPTATFADGRIAGFGGCNRYTGPIEEKAPGTIEIGPVAGTMMACADGVEIEPAYLQRLGMVTRYRVEGGRLHLWGDDDDRTQGLFFQRP